MQTSHLRSRDTFVKTPVISWISFAIRTILATRSNISFNGAFINLAFDIALQKNSNMKKTTILVAKLWENLYRSTALGTLHLKHSKHLSWIIFLSSERGPSLSFILCHLPSRIHRRLLLIVWDSCLRMVWRHANTFLIFHGRNGFPSLLPPEV